MLSSLLRPRRARQGLRDSYFPHFGYDSTEGSPRANGRNNSFHQTDDQERSSDNDEEDEEAEDEDEDGDGDGEVEPLLPIFSGPHLDSLPIYSLTHTIRLLIVSRLETTLTWDQLRSPQVSQFLIKPIQQQILASHLNSATLYALMANCLQFTKEVRTEPGTAGTSRTRALACELLAMKLLKEFTTRQLGMTPPETSSTYPSLGADAPSKTRTLPRAAKSSTLEIAIRAQAKKFLAHPLVVRQLEAIWAGTIVFHHAADNLHRSSTKAHTGQGGGYGTLATGPSDSRTLGLQTNADNSNVRRSVTLYDPRQASLFKLSRLRVPRYRQFLSTCSYAALLGLYLAVLIEHSLDISGLEVVLWFWSAGFMLDEIVGFNEQGFSLYILSIWNTFDLGILLMFVIYYGMRLYGIAIAEDQKHRFAGMAYDVLAANAVLLFPRLFSVLDHYRYFSQLLIAFRMMMLDLVAVMTLIVVACSGFFVAFTLSFSDTDHDAGTVAYALFQIVMGFTPAAWSNWDSYNLLGKAIMTIFLFICHFVIIVILLTVLTNSFTAIVRNANEEHQFVFAVNTISLVKSDALFSYIAPTNVFAWFLTPLRYVMPFSKYVRLNRTVIKITHFPVLWMIYAYEKTFLRRSAFVATDLIDQPHQEYIKAGGLHDDAGIRLFSPGRLREPSIKTFQKERALDEVFRRPFKDSTIRDSQKTRTRETTSNVVKNWMQGMGSEGGASPPVEQDPSIVKRLESRRPLSRSLLARRRGNRDFTSTTRSVVSDPEDLISTGVYRRPVRHREDSDLLTMSISEQREQTEGVGDDELSTNDEEDDAGSLDQKLDDDGRKGESDKENLRSTQEEDYLKTPTNSKAKSSGFSTPLSGKQQAATSSSLSRTLHPSPPQAGLQHNRNFSSTTVLFNPPPRQTHPSSTASSSPAVHFPGRASQAGSRPLSPIRAGKHPQRKVGPPRTPRARPTMPPRSQYQSVPNLSNISAVNIPGRAHPHRHRSSSIAFDLTSDLGDNNPRPAMMGGIPSSFATHFLDTRSRGDARDRRRQTGSVGGAEENSMMTRLVLARMNTLEEGFREVLKEVKDWRKEESGRSNVTSRRHSRVGRRKEGRKARSEDEEGLSSRAKVLEEQVKHSL